MKTIVKLVLVVALCAMGFAAPAAADTITVTNVALPFYESLTLNAFTVGANHYDGAGVNSHPLQAAGQLVLTTNIGLIGTWCVDLFHHISLGAANITYTTVALTKDNSGNNPANSNDLGATKIQQIQSLAAYGNLNLPTAGNPSEFSAVVQAAIWQVEYYGLGNARGVFGDTSFNNALDALLALVPSLDPAGGVQLQSLDGAGLFAYQNLELPVPEPGTLALVGSILVALGLLRRRLRQPATPSSI